MRKFMRSGIILLMLFLSSQAAAVAPADSSLQTRNQRLAAEAPKVYDMRTYDRRGDRRVAVTHPAYTLGKIASQLIGR